MSGPATVALLFLLGTWGAETSDDCSYLGLLKHLDLVGSSDALSLERPVKNWTTTTSVRVDMVMLGILDVAEKTQTITTQIWTQVSWMNELLRWNPSDFCGINMLTLPKAKLWNPDIYIHEDTSDTSTVQDCPLLTLFPSGWVSSRMRQRLSTTCQLNLYYFPFDTQSCSITFSSMNYVDDDMELGSFNNGSTLSFLSEQIMMTQGEWQLEKISITHQSFYKPDGSQSNLMYMVTFMRKPMLYVINLILPLMYFLVLDLSSFFIRGEKLSFKVTVLLSISVLLLILQDMLPSTEENLPLIAKYCLAVFTLVFMSILETVLVDFLKELDGSCCNKPRGSHHTQELEMQLESNSDKGPAAAEVKGQAGPETTRPSEGELLRLILSEVKAARQETGSPIKVDRKPGCYARLAKIIDCVYFVIYLITVIVYLVYLNSLWAANYYDYLNK